MIYMRAISDLRTTISNTVNGVVTDIDVKKGEVIMIPDELTSYPFIDFYIDSNKRVHRGYYEFKIDWDTLGYIPIDLLSLYFVRED